MGNVPTVDDLDAMLDAAYSGDKEVADMAKPEVRRARERKHALDPNDGRRKRATGRTAQFNLKVKPELKRRMIVACRQSGKPIAVIVEELFADYCARVEKKATRHA
jgi:hypothetical protein